MMDTWRVLEIVLVSVLVGTLLPVLFQLASALGSAKRLLETAGPRLERSLDEVTAAAARINHLGEKLEQLTKSVGMAATVGAAVGPAVAAAVRAFRAPHEDIADSDAAPYKEANGGQ